MKLFFCKLPIWG